MLLVSVVAVGGALLALLIVFWLWWFPLAMEVDDHCMGRPPEACIGELGALQLRWSSLCLLLLIGSVAGGVFSAVLSWRALRR